MATLYVPRPPVDDPWQGRSTRSYPIFAQVPPFPQKFWRYDNDDSAFWTGGATNPRIPPLRMPVGGGFPFKPPYWKFHYDDSAFWVGTPNPEIPPGRMPINGGVPVKPPYWKYHYDDASFWTGTANLPIPPVQFPVNGGIPIKPPYWKYNNDDPGFWVGAKSKNLFQPNLLGNYISNTDVLQNPVNCVLIGDQLYTATERTVEPGWGKIRYKTVMGLPKKEGD